jgi:hypothetical protein
LFKGITEGLSRLSTGLNLEGANVTVSIKRGEELLTKTAAILDVATGKCELTLLTSDLTVYGTYKYQWTADFEDGRSFSGRAREIFVDEKLAGVPPSGDPGTITVTVDGGEF